jgi:uncharacterized SAM-binding protein YcdF (DUF218 family)
MRRVLRRLFALFALGLLAAGIWGAFEGGRYLQHEDPLRKADAIFVLAGTRLERPLEAVDLYREGWAPAVALSPGQIEDAEAMVRARGIRYELESEAVRDAMSQMGVPASAILIQGASVDNTAQEGNLLRGLAAQHRWHTIIVVTSKYHTRRTGFAMRRALRGSGIDVIVRSTRYDDSDPATWWHHRSDFRWVLLEWQKLLAYRLGLGE